MTSLEQILHTHYSQEIPIKVAVNGHHLVPWRQAFPLETLFSHEFLIQKYFKSLVPSKNKVLGLYLGIESFQIFEPFHEQNQLWKSEYGPIALQQPNYKNLFLQPTTTIEEGFWNTAYLSLHKSGYEPGPMCFGKSVKPTFLDVLYIENKLDQQVGLSTQLVEKSKKRINETLYTYSKDSLTSELILKLGLQAIAVELARFSNNIVYCTGPLAKLLLPLLKTIPVQKQFRLKESECCVLESLGMGDTHGH
ncbi:MAG: hypothetical protein KDD40_04535 [Bdellovibrionales bacterium]|nr:hypothetical protein [Bdellovibrionales bacterium]